MVAVALVATVAVIVMYVHMGRTRYISYFSEKTVAIHCSFAMSHGKVFRSEYLLTPAILDLELNSEHGRE